MGVATGKCTSSIFRGLPQARQNSFPPVILAPHLPQYAWSRRCSGPSARAGGCGFEIGGSAAATGLTPVGAPHRTQNLATAGSSHAQFGQYTESVPHERLLELYFRLPLIIQSGNGKLHVTRSKINQGAEIRLCLLENLDLDTRPAA